MSVGVIGITLALPGLLYLLVTNAERVSSEWHGGAHVSLFLRGTVDSDQAQTLAAHLEKRTDVNRVRVISSEQALSEFKELSGFGEALDALSSNPLPSLLMVIPEPRYEQPEALARMVLELQSLPAVELAQLDMEWLQRFNVILKLTRRALIVLSVLLALAVLLIVSNTIRLAIVNRRDEIEIIQLIGGTDRFIRRPFLYSGMLQGFLGAGVAIVLIALCLHLLRPPIQVLAGLYGSGFRVAGLSIFESLTVLAIGMGLGWLASRWSVGRHLDHIQPS
jgi:cell division transport system permease protein